MAYASRISKGSCRCTACIAWSSAMLVPSMRATRRCHGVFLVCFYQRPSRFFSHPVSCILSSWIWIRKTPMDFERCTLMLWHRDFACNFVNPRCSWGWNSTVSCHHTAAAYEVFFVSIVFLTWKLCFRYGWSQVDIIAALCWSRGWCLDRDLVPLRSCEFFSVVFCKMKGLSIDHSSSGYPCLKLCQRW